MPHIVVKLWPGKTDAQKKELAEAIARQVMETLDYQEKSVSVAVEEVEQARWREDVYIPDIVEQPERIYKKPGYTM